MGQGGGGDGQRGHLGPGGHQPSSLSLTSSWCRNKLAFRDSPSLVESLRGFLMAVCMQDEEGATFWWPAFPSSGASSPPFLPPDKFQGIDRRLVVTVGTVAPLLG